MDIAQRFRDTLGRFLPNSTIPTVETPVESLPKAELVTEFSIEISINGKPVDFTNITKEEAVILFNFGHLNKEHFRALCQLEGWRFEEELEYEDEDEDEDEEYD